jgi:8-oxo-dGTP pyrophosphatase MutT (NUDIX family)
VRWVVHGERAVYESEWVRLCLADVEVPGLGRIEHHVVRTPRKAAGTILRDPERGVLLLWRHRFITDTWGWEIPAGRVETGENPEEAAQREAIEETGWRPVGLQPLLSYQPANGLSDQKFHLFLSERAEHLGEPTDTAEFERLEWVSIERLSNIAKAGEMLDGLSLTAVLYVLAFGLFGQ